MQADLQILTELLRKVRDQVGDDAFLNGRRLVAYAEDLMPGRSARNEINLIRAGYSAAEAKLVALAKLLISGKGNPKQAASAANTALVAAALPEEDAEVLIGGLLAAFGVQLKLAQPKGAPRKGRKILWVALAVAVAAVALFALMPRRDGAARDEPAEVSGEEAQVQTELEAAQPDDAEGIAVEISEPEPTAEAPKVEPEISLEYVDAPTYGENITQLSQYAIYEAQGKHFSFGYPRALYKEVHLESGIDYSTYVFTAEDGSSLQYTNYWLMSKKPVREWRELLTAKLTENKTDVQTLAVSDESNEGHFYLTAREGSLDVLIVGAIYTSGTAESMILKYPAPQSEEDRLRKAYYVECLYCLAGFSDSEQQGFKLRTYEEFMDENGGSAS